MTTIEKLFLEIIVIVTQVERKNQLRQKDFCTVDFPIERSNYGNERSDVYLYFDRKIKTGAEVFFATSSAGTHHGVFIDFADEYDDEEAFLKAIEGRYNYSITDGFLKTGSFIYQGVDSAIPDLEPAWVKEVLVRCLPHMP